MAINVKEEAGSVQTIEEFERVLGIFKVKHPEKYASRLGSGDFDRQAKSLGIAWESEAAKEARLAAEKAKATAEKALEKAKKEEENKAKVEAKALADKK